MFPLDFCYLLYVSWGHQLLYQCSCEVWGYSYTLASGLTLLPCHHCKVYGGACAVVWALAHQSAFLGPVRYSPCSDVYVTVGTCALPAAFPSGLGDRD